jgi:hypothetical protein
MAVFITFYAGKPWGLYRQIIKPQKKQANCLFAVNQAFCSYYREKTNKTGRRIP